MKKTILNPREFTNSPKQMDLSRILNFTKEEIWKEIVNYKNMTLWFPMIKSVEITKKGNTQEFGVGCKRECKFGNDLFEEEILHFDPPNKYAFKIKDNSMIKDHLAIFSIEEVNGKNSFRFQSFFEPQGNFIKKYMMKNVMLPSIGKKALKNFEKKLNNN